MTYSGFMGNEEHLIKHYKEQGYDIFTWVTIPDSKELTNFLTYYLGNLEGVNKTETFIILEVLKRGL